MNGNKQVVRALQGNVDLHDLNEGFTPGLNRAVGLFEGSSYDAGQSSEDLKKVRKVAQEGQEQSTTSECSGPSSECGQHPSTSTSESQQNTQEMEMRNVRSNT